jgi:Protein of unknown function (DUF3096)
LGARTVRRRPQRAVICRQPNVSISRSDHGAGIQLVSGDKGSAISRGALTAENLHHEGNEEMTVTALGIAHIQPIVSLIAGILILIMPQLLNYIVAIFLIVSLFGPKPSSSDEERL